MNREDLSAHCRVCLTLPDASELLDLNIIYDQEQQLSFYDCFALCTNISLKDTNDFPHNLCKSCGLEMQMAYDFHKKVGEATRVLKQWYDEFLKLEDINYLTTDVKEASISSETQVDAIVESVKVDLSNNIGIVANGFNTETLEDENLIVDYEQIEDVEENNSVEMTVEHLDNFPGFNESINLPEDNLEEQLETVEEHLEMEDYQSIEILEDEDAETLQTEDEDKISMPSELLNDSINLSDVDGDDIELVDDENDNEEVFDEVLDEMYDEVLTDPEVIEQQSNVTTHQRSTKMAKTPETLKTISVRKRYAGKSTCDQCFKEFPNHSRMMSHRRCHDIDRPKFPCEQCGRMYMTKQAMESHVRTVHAKKGHTCPICQKIYPIKKCLEVHLRFHTGDFPFVCELCGRKFAQFSHLKTHKNVKHNNVRFSCDYPGCGKYFTSSASLRNHEFSHSIMPFECIFCQRGYPAKAKLKVHIKRKHGKDLTLDELEPMRRFQVARSKLSLVKVIKADD